MSYNKGLYESRNFDTVLQNIVSVLHLWTMCNLSLYGKITVLQSLVVSEVMYLCNVLMSPSSLIAGVKDNIIKFLWKGVPKVKYNTLFSNTLEGGLGLPGVDSMIKARILWIKKYIVENQSLGAIKPHSYFKRNGIQAIGVNLDKKCVVKNLPKFYKMCLLDWCNLYDGELHNSSAVLAQPLWNNKHIKIAGKSVYFRYLSDQLCERFNR